MNEIALQQIVIACLKQGLTALRIAAAVKQRYQPLTVGINSEPTLYVQKTTDENVGFIKRSYAYNNNVMTRSEEQPKITTFQINATAIQTPSDLVSLTAADYVDYARYIFQSETGIAFLLSKNVQVLRIAKARVTQWKDDMRRYEADPSLDVSFVHTLIITSIMPSTKIIVSDIQQVNT